MTCFRAGPLLGGLDLPELCSLATDFSASPVEHDLAL
jgi:hypothetical protein